MFKVTSEPRFSHSVTVMVPTDGGHKEQTFTCTFKVEDVEALDKLQGEEGQRGVLQRVVCGMSDLVGDDDQPLTYSDALRDQLIGVPYVRIAMFLAYMGAVTKAKAGN
jgi:hypothetical protein